MVTDKDITLVSFTPKKPTHTAEDREGHLPPPELIKELLLDKPMGGCILIVTNEDGIMSYWMDNFNTYEAIGLMETTKAAMIANTLNDEDYYD